MTTTPPRTRQSTRLTGGQRAEQLLDVAEELFMAKGYDRTSIEDIARAAGVTRPVVYDHHGSKEGVYLACVERARLRLLERYRSAIAGLDDPREVLQAAADAWFSIVERDPARWAVLYGGTSVPLTGDLGDRVFQQRSKNLGYYTRAVQRWARPDVPPDQVSAVAQMISGVGEQLARWWLTNRHVPRADVVEYYTEFCLNGLQPLMPEPDHG